MSSEKYRERKTFTSIYCNVHKTKRSRFQNENIDNARNSSTINLDAPSEADKKIKETIQVHNALTLLIDNAGAGEAIFCGAPNQQQLSRISCGYELTGQHRKDVVIKNAGFKEEFIYATYRRACPGTKKTSEVVEYVLTKVLYVWNVRSTREKLHILSIFKMKELQSMLRVRGDTTDKRRGQSQMSRAAEVIEFGA